MMPFEIVENVGVGPIRFGMTRAEVREALGVPVEEFSKSSSSTATTDSFDTLGVHVYYRASGQCQAVEIASPAVPEYRGRPLLGGPFGETLRWLQSIGCNPTLDDVGLNVTAAGFGLYCPGHSEDDSQLIESVFVFEPGYYDVKS